MKGMSNRNPRNKAILELLRKNYLLVESFVILLLSGITMLLAFGNPQNNLIYTLDEIFPFNPQYFLTHMFAWSYIKGTGQLFAWMNLDTLPYVGFIYFFHNLVGLSLGWSQYFLYTLLMFLTGFSMLLFTREVYDGKLKQTIAPLLAALLYSFNLYIAYFVIDEFYDSWFLYALLPLFLLLLFKSSNKIKENQFPLREVALASVVLYFMSFGLSGTSFANRILYSQLSARNSILEQN